MGMYIKHTKGPKEISPIRQSSKDPNRGVSINLIFTKSQIMKLQNKKILEPRNKEVLEYTVVIGVLEYWEQEDNVTIRHNGSILDGPFEGLKYSAVSFLNDGTGVMSIRTKK
jgi:hypothetical protein